MELARKILVKGAIITVTIALLAKILVSTDAAVAVLAGGLLAIVNFRLSSKLLSRAVSPDVDPNTGKATVVAAFLFRYVLLGVVLLTAIRRGIDPFFLLIGLSAVVGAIFLSYRDLKRVTA